MTPSRATGRAWNGKCLSSKAPKLAAWALLTAPSHQGGVIFRTNWRRACSLALILAALALLLWVVREQVADFEWRLFLATFRSLDPAWMAGSLLFLCLSYLGRAVRWRVMIAPLRRRASILGLLHDTAIGFTAIVIFGRAGELVRPYLIAVREQVSFSSQMAAWLLERIYDLLVVLLIFGVGLTHFHAAAGHVGPGLRWALDTGGQAVAVICSVCLLVLVIFSRNPDWMRRRIGAALGILPAKYRRPAVGLADSFIEGTGSTRDLSSVIQLVAYTVLEWFIIAGCVLCIFRAVPATSRLGFTDCLVLLGFIALGSVVQLPGIGGGMQVVSIAVLTELFGISLEVASGVAIILWLTTFVTIVPVGLVLGLRAGLSWRNMRHIRDSNS